MAPRVRWRCGLSKKRDRDCPSEIAKVLSITSFQKLEWKNVMAEHQYQVVYRLLWINRIMGLLSTDTSNDLVQLVEWLLGYEDRSWHMSEVEEEYVLSMASFLSSCKRPQNTWPHQLIQNGRSMDLFKDILRLELVNGLPTIYWIDKEHELFLLVGPQRREETQALLQQLTDNWNQHRGARTHTIHHLPNLPDHLISNETRNLAFRSEGPERGDVLKVFEGLVDKREQTAGLGVALVPPPIEAYLQHLWIKEVYDTSSTLSVGSMSQNTVKLVLPWILCTHCSKPKEVGTLFGLRTNVPGRLASVNMHEILLRLERFRDLFGTFTVIPDLNETRVCCLEL